MSGGEEPWDIGLVLPLNLASLVVCSGLVGRLSGLSYHVDLKSFERFAGTSWRGRETDVTLRSLRGCSGI